jgi:RND family efflux transporter MFP subunit
MNRAVKYSLLALAGVLIVTFVAYRLIDAAKPPAPKKQPTPLVSVAQPARQDLHYTLQYEGDVLPVLQANIFSKVAGTLESVLTDMGKVVKGGQLIAVIDTTEAYQNELQAAATYYNAKATEARARELAAKNLAAQQDVDNAIGALRSAEANYQATKIRLEYAKIRAPFHGYVTKRYLDPGTTVSATPTVTSGASTIVTIMDIDTVKIVINVLDRDIPSIHPGLRATVQLDALPGREYYGFVSRSAQAINTTTRTMPVEILIPNRDESLKPGAFARVSLALGEHPQAITVPVEAMLNDKDGSYVFAVENAVAKRKPVQTGITQAGRLEILSGLDGTERVIVTGQSFAKPNAKVIVVRNQQGARDTTIK